MKVRQGYLATLEKRTATCGENWCQISLARSGGRNTCIERSLGDQWMKLEQVKTSTSVSRSLQETILEQRHLSHAYLFTGSFGDFEMASSCPKVSFVQKGVWPCGTSGLSRLKGWILRCQRLSDRSIKSSNGSGSGIWSGIFISQATKDPSKSLSSAMQTGSACQCGQFPPKVIERTSEWSSYFLLTDERLVLPTIKSRVQQVHF